VPQGVSRILIELVATHLIPTMHHQLVHRILANELRCPGSAIHALVPLSDSSVPVVFARPALNEHVRIIIAAGGIRSQKVGKEQGQHDQC
jgi:hypothetical protein